MKQLFCQIVPFFLTAVLSALVSVPEAVKAEDNADLSRCLADNPDASASTEHPCFGRVVDLCMERFPDEPVIPLECWENELSLWKQHMNEAYQLVLTEIKAGEYTGAESIIRLSQGNWIKQKDLDCKLEIASNPQTFDTIGAACRTETTMKRFLFLQSLLGADWHAFQE